MTEFEKKKIEDLSRCRFLPGSWEKRFVRSLLEMKEKELSDKQKLWLHELHHRYRKQIHGLQEK